MAAAFFPGGYDIVWWLFSEPWLNLFFLCQLVKVILHKNIVVSGRINIRKTEVSDKGDRAICSLNLLMLSESASAYS